MISHLTINHSKKGSYCENAIHPISGKPTHKCTCQLKQLQKDKVELWV